MHPLAEAINRPMDARSLTQLRLVNVSICAETETQTETKTAEKKKSRKSKLELVVVCRSDFDA